MPALPAIAISSLAILLFSGIYLSVQLSAQNLAWPRAAVAGMLLVAPLGATTGRRLREIRRLCAEDRPAKPELQVRLQDPFLKISLGVRIAVVLGIVLLMAAKPAKVESLTIIGVSTLIGLGSSLLAFRRRPLVSAADAKSRS